MTATMGRESVGTPLMRRAFVAPLAVGLLGVTISMIGITIPSLWYDEAATVSSTTRSLPQLWAELGNVGAVHGLYYLLMHVIFEVFGYSPLSLRMPSAIAVGIATALVVVLGRQVNRPRLAVIAALVFCLIPRVTWMGTEGRSYAMTATLAVLATVVLLRAIRTATPGAWILYALVTLVSIATFIYLALIVVAHAVTMVLLLRERTRRSRSNARNWLIAAAAAGLASLSFAAEVVSQSGQLSWTKPLNLGPIRGVLRSQWFYSSEPFAIAAWAFILVGLVMLLLSLR
ncbi:MAG: glycosyltransferase family 39 protein, partial [Salinibacterium sp.]|nr:glycosyltransferase family 39 protein [Salinibacterium sp.]